MSGARMAKTALAAAANGGASEADFYNAKLTTGRYYMQKLLPETGLRLARIKAGGETVMGPSPQRRSNARSTGLTRCGGSSPSA